MYRKRWLIVLQVFILSFCLIPAQAQNQQLPRPQNLTVRDNTLSWNAVTNASGYQVRWRARNRGQWNNASVMPGMTSYKFTTLDFDVPYAVGVRALAASVPGYSNSRWRTAATRMRVLKATATATATATSASVARAKLPAPDNFDKTSENAVRWDAVADAARYQLQVTGEEGTVGIDIARSQRAHTVVGLIDGKTYLVRIRALGNRSTHQRNGRWSGYVQLRPGSGVTVPSRRRAASIAESGRSASMTWLTPKALSYSSP